MSQNAYNPRLKELADHAWSLKFSGRTRQEIETGILVFSQLKHRHTPTQGEVQAITDIVFSKDDLPDLAEVEFGPYLLVPDHFRLYYGSNQTKFIKLRPKKVLFLQEAAKLYARGKLPYPSERFMFGLNELTGGDCTARIIRDWCFNTGHPSDKLYGGENPGLIRVTGARPSEFYLDLDWMPPAELFQSST